VSLEAEYIALDKALALCRLLADEVRVPGHVRDSIVNSLVYWWADSTSADTIEEIKTLLGRLSDSSAGAAVVQKLIVLVESPDRRLAHRTVEVLRHFQASAEASAAVLVNALTTNSGPTRWRAATALAELGLEDAVILEKLWLSATNRDVIPMMPIRSARVFDLKAYQSLLHATRSGVTGTAKGKALEDLAEYIFLCVPGLNTIARNLRTLTEEIDIAVSNGGAGFWHEIGNPFVVECKNVAAPVDAAMIRNFRVKLQTKGLKGGFMVTTSRVSRDGMVEIRQALSESRLIVAVEGDHLDAVSDGRDMIKMLEERFYTCRLL